MNLGIAEFRDMHNMSTVSFALDSMSPDSGGVNPMHPSSCWSGHHTWGIPLHNASSLIEPRVCKDKFSLTYFYSLNRKHLPQAHELRQMAPT